VTITPELEAQILHCYQVEKSRANTIACKLHVHHGTVKRVLAQAGLLITGEHARPSQLDPFLPFIHQMLKKFPTQTASRLFVKVRERGYGGGPDHFRHVIACHRQRPRAKACSRLRALHSKQSGVEQKKSQTDRARHLPQSAYTLRIELSIRPALQVDVRSAVDKRSFPVPADPSLAQAGVQRNWSREFMVSGKHTLEQLREIILHLLGWTRHPLYQFLIADRVYAHLVPLDADDFFIGVKNPCLSCDIPIRLLNLSVGSIFSCIFDFVSYPIFRITVLGIRPETKKVVPALLSYRGKNIIQFPGTMCKAEARAFANRTPEVAAPEPRYERFRVRFIRDEDVSVLKRWRTSNNKKHWQKAVTILESRNISPKNIATKIEQSKGNVLRWIQAFNRFGLERLKKPHGRRGPIKSHNTRPVVSDQKARRILEIFHAKPSTYGINRSNWTRQSIKRAYEQEYNEAIGESVIRLRLRSFGYTARKARRVLTSPDPNYREKVDLLLTTLHKLKPRELLFFVDELGPLRVKKYGGRALVRKNEVLTYQQEQKHRGVIMISGALSATTNQVTWIYGSAKDTSAMIDLMELLYNQYFSASKLYVTWDAASWHKSATLVDSAYRINSASNLISVPGCDRGCFQRDEACCYSSFRLSRRR
jgi:transposase